MLNDRTVSVNSRDGTMSRKTWHGRIPLRCSVLYRSWWCHGLLLASSELFHAASNLFVVFNSARLLRYGDDPAASRH